MFVFCSHAVSQEKCIDTTLARARYVIRDYPAVGQLVMDNGSCTAFLVDAQVAMTAAHCIENESSHAVIGEVVRIGGQSIRVAEQLSMYTEEVKKRGMPDNYSDFAFLVLERPVLGIKPLVLATKYPRRSDLLAVIGYGCTQLCSENEKMKPVDAGVKRIGYIHGITFKVSGYSTDEVFVCPGDSGGPLINLKTGEVVGVVSSFAHSEHEDGWFFESSRFANTIPFARAIKNAEGP